MQSKALGYTIRIDPDAPRPEEFDTFTCCHCNRVVRKAPNDPMATKALAARCTCCDKLCALIVWEKGAVRLKGGWMSMRPATGLEPNWCDKMNAPKFTTCWNCTYCEHVFVPNQPGGLCHERSLDVTRDARSGCRWGSTDNKFIVPPSST